MKIQINDTWRISTDPQNFIIEKKTIVGKEGDNKGNINWVSIGFYPTLEQALRGYSRRFMLDGDETTVDEIKSSLDVLKAEISRVTASIRKAI